MTDALLRPAAREILHRLQDELCDRYQNKLDQVILFGSQARGDASENSDIDVLAVLKDDEINPFLEYLNWADWVVDIMLEYGELVNLLFTSRERFSSVESPLYQNIRLEGIVIYENRNQVVAG